MLQPLPRVGRRASAGSWLAGATLLLVGALGLGWDDVPWPLGAPPSHAEITELVLAAEELFALERQEEMFGAQNPAEDSEHIRAKQEDIDAGLHTAESLFTIGDALFEHAFRALDGYGASESPTLLRVHDGVRGGLDTFSCAGCHSVGGPDGGGTLTQNAFLFGDGDDVRSAVVRNAPHTLGLGMVQALAYEMSGDLARKRDDAIAIAQGTGGPAKIALVTKGVDFGFVIAGPDGSVDTSLVVGVHTDLIVRPFGWKGEVALLRRFVEDAARIHFGVQSHPLAIGHETDPAPELLGDGPDWFDPDGDGKARELEEGSLTAGAVYLALLEVPVILPPHGEALRERWARGSTAFTEVGCETCHRRTLELVFPTWDEYPDTTAGPPFEINLFTDGELPRGTKSVELFSDLKRHDMGEELADPHDSPSGVPRSEFLTRPLWGLADTGPYLHDGRALTIPEAIVLHGGEATASRDAYEALPSRRKQDLHVFLLSLTRTPRLRVPR